MGLFSRPKEDNWATGQTVDASSHAAGPTQLRGYAEPTATHGAPAAQPGATYTSNAGTHHHSSHVHPNHHHNGAAAAPAPGAVPAGADNRSHHSGGGLFSKHKHNDAPINDGYGHDGYAQNAGVAPAQVQHDGRHHDSHHSGGGLLGNKHRHDGPVDSYDSHAGVAPGHHTGTVAQQETKLQQARRAQAEAAAAQQRSDSLANEARAEAEREAQLAKDRVRQAEAELKAANAAHAEAKRL